MEIIIDDALVGEIVTQETLQAGADIDRLGPVAAYENSRSRHDARLSSAADAHTLACKDGCYWCCYFTVDVRPVEALRIGDFMRNSLPAEDRAKSRFRWCSPGE